MSDASLTGGVAVELTDQRLAELIVQAQNIERELRRYYASATDEMERAHALIGLRQATALRKPLEKWNVARACARTQATVVTR